MASSFVRNSVVNAFAGVFTTLGGFVGTILIARILGVRGTGIVAFATWAVTVAVIISDLGLTGCLPRFLPELLARDEGGDADRLTYQLFRAFLGYVTLIALCFALYAAWLAWNYPDALGRGVPADTYSISPLFWLLIGLAAFLQALGNFATCWIKGLQEFGVLARVALAGCLVQILATAISASLFDVTGALVAMAASPFIAVLALFDLPRARGPISAALRQRVRRFSLETWGSYILTAFFASRMEVFFLERSWGSHSVGLFTVSLTLSNLATQVPLLLTGALLPRLSDHIGRDEVHEAKLVYRTSVSLMSLLVFPACLGMAALAPVLLPLMYGRDFAAAVPTATILLAASALVATSSIASVYLIAIERTRFLLGTAVVGATLSILAGLTVVPTFGPVAAACARGGIQVAIALATLWYMYRHLQCPTPIGTMARLLGAACICAVTARVVVTLMPTAQGVALAVLLGAVTYAASLRIFRPLPSNDVQKLRTAVMSLPRLLRPAASVGLQLIWS